MTEEKLHDLAVPYAVDAVDDEERAAFEAHLLSCPACQRVVSELSDAAVGLSDGLEVEPPPGLRDRVLRAVAADAAVVPLDVARRRRAGGRRTWLLAAASAVLVGVGAWAVSETSTPDPVEQVVEASDAVEHTSPETPGLRVVTSVAADRAVLEVPDDLEPPPAGSVYQAWFIGEDGTARSAGVLGPGTLEDREALLEGSVAGAAAVGLTVEPDGGSDQPTSEPVAVVSLG